jgi:peroxiredoxin
MKLDRILQMALAVMLAAFGVALYASLHETIVNAGDKAPDFQFKDDSGKQYNVHNFGGKLLLLNFWASWCGPCVEEIPALNQMARALGPKGLIVLGVSIDKDEKAYKDFLGRLPLAYPSGRDPEQVIEHRYGTFQIPESYLIDSSGHVVEKFVSEQAWASPQMISHVGSLM